MRPIGARPRDINPRLSSFYPRHPRRMVLANSKTGFTRPRHRGDASGIGVQGSGNQRGEAPSFPASSRMDDWGWRRSCPGNCFLPEPRTLAT
ncbi:MAG: hypothetical protein MZV70_50665 [Desulfobacterales bacterium]|nr:hypothetical protein [Desulfobacterales bacterium]